MSRPLKRLINPELAVIICIGGLRPWIVLVPSLVAEEVFLGHSKRTILIKSKWWAMAQLWLCPPFIWLHRMTELYKYCCVYRSQCLIGEVTHPRVSRLFFAERRSASAVPSRSASQTANDLQWCSFCYFSTHAWLQSPMDTQLVAESDRCHAFCTAWRNFMSSVMFTGHSALLVACPFPVYYYLVDVFVPRPTPTSNLSLAAPTLDCSLSCLACPGSKLITEKVDRPIVASWHRNFRLTLIKAKQDLLRLVDDGRNFKLIFRQKIMWGTY